MTARTGIYPAMTDIEEPGYAERDDDDFSDETGGGIGFDDPLDHDDDDDDAAGSDEDLDLDVDDDDV